MVTTREKSGEYLLGHWSAVMKERIESGMSIKAFCRSKGLRENVYHYWQRKIREKTNKSQDTEYKKEASIVPVGWALCEAPRNEENQGVVQIEIGKTRINVNEDTDYKILAQVCRMLVSIC